MLAIVVLLGTALACAQAPSPDPVGSGAVLPALKSLLGLTDDQTRLIAEKNIAFDSFAADKHRRLHELQAEIDQETQRETLDPVALGVRTMEAELIRREIRSAQERLSQGLRNILNPQQLSQLDRLARTAELLPGYQEALSIHLLLSEPVSAVPPTTPASIGQGVEGRAIDAAGRPVSGGLVVPRSLDEPSPPIPELAVLTDKDGQYSWRLPAGNFEISISAQGFRTARKPVTVKAGQVSRLDFVLERQ
jgi:hypothetical protein